MSSTNDPQPLPSAPLLPSLAVKQLTSHTYSANFPEDFCIGSVPHGGYISSIFLSVAAAHFNTTLAAQNQPDTIVLGLNFVRRTNAGLALLRVSDVKLGRQTSVIHVALLQGSGNNWRPEDADSEKHATEEVVGYMTNSNMALESGPSHVTGWKLTPAVPSASFPAQMPDRGPGANWTKLRTLPFAGFRKATSHVEVWMPTQQIHSSNNDNNINNNGNSTKQKQQQLSFPAGRVDQWVRMRSGERWTNLHLGYLADFFPRLIDFMEPPPPPSSTSTSSSSSSTPTHRVARNWYPTLSLNLDIKQQLSNSNSSSSSSGSAAAASCAAAGAGKDGVDWLNIVAEMRSVQHGRSDISLVILDAQGRLVASSNHVCLVVPVARNVATRSEARSRNQAPAAKGREMMGKLGTGSKI